MHDILESQYQIIDFYKNSVLRFKGGTNTKLGTGVYNVEQISVLGDTIFVQQH